MHQAVRRLQGGESAEEAEEDYGLLYRHAYPFLYNFFSRRRGLAREAEDLAQETLARAFERLGQYRFEAPFNAWLRSIAVSVWKNAWRRTQTGGRAGIHVPLGEPSEVFELPSPRQSVGVARTSDPEGDILEREKALELGRALADLPTGMRRSLELQLQGLKYREIAAVLDVGLGTVRSQIFEARKRLRPVLIPETARGAGPDEPV